MKTLVLVEHDGSAIKDATLATVTAASKLGEVHLLVVGANAGEMISLWALAHAKQMNVREIADFVAPYPTMSEIGKRAAISYFVPEAQKPRVRKLIRFLRVFG